MKWNTVKFKLFLALALLFTFNNSFPKAAGERTGKYRTIASEQPKNNFINSVANTHLVTISILASQVLYYGGYSSLSYNPLFTTMFVLCSKGILEMFSIGIRDLLYGVLGKALVTSFTKTNFNDSNVAALKNGYSSAFDSRLSKVIKESGFMVAFTSLYMYFAYNPLHTRAKDLYTCLSSLPSPEQALMCLLLISILAKLSFPVAVFFGSLKKSFNDRMTTTLNIFKYQDGN